MKILVAPRDRNPYQELLYGNMRACGSTVRYVGAACPSMTASVFFLPVELALYRLAGYRIFHIHWVFAFRMPLLGRGPIGRAFVEAWFRLVLAVARALGYRVIWTAHNVLPHSRIFNDDARARRTLVRAAAGVVIHSDATLEGLRAIGAEPRRVVVIPHGPLAARDIATDRRPCDGPDLRHLLYFGTILPYKGVEDLLAAVGSLGTDPGFRLTVAGECPDDGLARRLRQTSQLATTTLTLTRLSEGQLSALLLAADAVVLPFREVTTSGTAVLAMSYGRPVVVPSLPAFADVPKAAAIKYDGSSDGLIQVLRVFAGMPDRELQEMGVAAWKYVNQATWRDASCATRLLYTRVIAESSVRE